MYWPRLEELRFIENKWDHVIHMYSYNKLIRKLKQQNYWPLIRLPETKGCFSIPLEIIWTVFVESVRNWSTYWRRFLKCSYVFLLESMWSICAVNFIFSWTMSHSRLWSFKEDVWVFCFVFVYLVAIAIIYGSYTWNYVSI